MGEYADDAAPTNGVRFRLHIIESRLKRIEDLKPEVMAYEISETRNEVRALKRAFYTFAFSVVGSSILFAFTVFALIGKHP